jgi:hypothetical protein
MPAKGPNAIFPPPMPRYDYANEAAFRNDVARYLQEVAAYPATLEGLIDHGETHDSGDPILDGSITKTSGGVVDGETFTASDATDVSGYNSWAGSSGFFKIYSNRAKQMWTGTGYVYNVYKQFPDLANDFVISAEVTLTTNFFPADNIGLALRTRSTDLNPCIIVKVHPTEVESGEATLELYRHNAGGTRVDEATAVTTIPWPVGATRQLWLEVIGTTVTAEVRPSGGGGTIASTSMTLTDELLAQDYIRLYAETTAAGGGSTELYIDTISILGPSTIGISAPITVGTWHADTIEPAYGGTGLTGYTAGDLLYSSATDVLAKLAIGTAGYVLASASGFPAWVDSAASTQTLTNKTLSTGCVVPAALVTAGTFGTGDYTVDGALICDYPRVNEASEASATTHDDYALSNTGVLYCTGTMGFTGFASGAAGRVLYLRVVGGEAVTLYHEDANSSAENRLSCPSGTDYTVPSGAGVVLVYLSAVSRWAVFG